MAIRLQDDAVVFGKAVGDLYGVVAFQAGLYVGAFGTVFRVDAVDRPVFAVAEEGAGRDLQGVFGVAGDDVEVHAVGIAEVLPVFRRAVDGEDDAGSLFFYAERAGFGEAAGFDAGDVRV